MSDDKFNYFKRASSKFNDVGFVIKLFAVTAGLPMFVVADGGIRNNSVFLTDVVDNNYHELDLVLVYVTNVKHDGTLNKATNNTDSRYYAFIDKVIKNSDSLSLDIKILSDNTKVALITPSDPVKISKGDILNYTQPGTITTSYGRYFLNQVLLATPFGSKIPYINDVFTAGAMKTQIKEKMIDGEISTDEYDSHIDNEYTYCHMSELVVPATSVKALTTSTEVEKRKKELFKEYAGRLHQPIIAKKIAEELSTLDQKYLEDDPSKIYYDGRGPQAWSVKRSKMVVNIGGIPAFSDEVGKLHFIDGSLQEGWQPKNFDVIANEIYMGSYTRGVGTQLGGELTKIIIRMFQASRIAMDDCGTKMGLTFDVTSKNVSEFFGMYVAGVNTIITRENSSKFIGKRVTIRSPETCKAGGSTYCFKCFGELYRKRGVNELTLDGIYPTSTFMLLEMKNMHGVEVKTKNISLDDYFISGW